jgi:hypothetical protein
MSRRFLAGCNGCQFMALMAIVMYVPLPLRMHKYGGDGRSSGHTNNLSIALHSAIPVPTFASIKREWESRPPESPTAELHLYGCVGAQVFLGSVLVTARFVCSTSAGHVLRRRRRSRDCIAYICLHRLRTTTSNIHTRCLV